MIYPILNFKKNLIMPLAAGGFTCIEIDKNNIDIDNLMLKLKEKGIPTRKIFMPASEMPYLKKFSKSCPNAYEIYNQGICLPSSTLNEEEDIRKAASIIKETLNG